MSTRLESVRVALNVLREGILLILLLMLLFLPSRVNDILIEAGFTRASILGFDWENRLDKAAEETESARQEVQQLNEQLGEYAQQVDRIAQTVTQPALRSQAQTLARSIQHSQVSARELGTRLEKSATSQRELMSELRKRIQP